MCPLIVRESVDISLFLVKVLFRGRCFCDILPMGQLLFSVLLERQSVSKLIARAASTFYGSSNLRGRREKEGRGRQKEIGGKRVFYFFFCRGKRKGGRSGCCMFAKPELFYSIDLPDRWEGYNNNKQLQKEEKITTLMTDQQHNGSATALPDRPGSPDSLNQKDGNNLPSPSSSLIKPPKNDWIQNNKINNRAILHTLPEGRKESLHGCEDLLKQGLISVEDPERIYELTEILGKG